MAELARAPNGLPVLYFAYGSNLCVARLRERIATSEPKGAARLPGHRLVCNKPGHDGSGKANLVVDPDHHVWGALYLMEPGQLDLLDRFEGGYERTPVRVEGCKGAFHDALTYRSDPGMEEMIPFDWYRGLILDGARQHDLPAAWLARLEALPCRPDPTRTEVRSVLAEEDP